MRSSRVIRCCLSGVAGRLRCAAGREEGFMLIEVVVSAVILVVLALGLYAGLDGAARASGQNKARSVAAALAQQEQERLRASAASDLANYHVANTVTIGGMSYTVTTDTTWISDSSGTLSCSNNSAAADYLQLTTKVTWSNMGPVSPVLQESLLAPPSGASATQGNLSVLASDSAGNPITSLPVTLGSPANLTVNTNSLGCAVFNYVAAGTYTVTASLPGYVDLNGNTTATQQASVTAGTNTLSTLAYDRAAQIDVSFDTKVGASAPQAAQAQSITLTNANVPGPPAVGMRQFAGAGFQTTISATNLYPVSGGYGIYAGNCANDNPTSYSSSYFSTNPGLVVVTSGQHTSVTVREPALNLAVTKSGAALANAHVTITNSSCSGSETYPAQSTNAQGALPSPGYPFGTYLVCADDGTRHISASVTNTNPAGSATKALAVPTSGNSQKGVCT